MKRIIYLFCIVFVAYSCQKEKATDGYIINVHIDKAQNDALAKLLKYENQNSITIDSTTVVGNDFSLKGQIDQPDMYFLNIEGINGNFPLILENAEIDIDIYADSLLTSEFSGGKETTYFKDYQDYIKSLRERNTKISNEFNKANEVQDTSRVAELRKQYEDLLKENDAYELKYMTENTDALLSALILERNLNGKKYDFNKIKELYTNFSDGVKLTRAAKAIEEFISFNQNTAIGQPAPVFSGPNPEGEIISLDKIKGEVTIIDFWAAWCGPCRRENPNLVKVYEKYNDRGLEIIGVSLDGNPRQKGSKEAWIDAIKNDNLTWPQISNLQYFNGPIAKQYNIKSIPATFIINAEGIIVAKNLRGTALERKISEMLN